MHSAATTNDNEKDTTDEGAVEQRAVAKSGLGWDMIRQALVGLVCGLVVVTAYDYTRQPPPKIVTVDLSGYFEAKKQQYIKQMPGDKALTSDELIIKTNRLAAAVDQVLQNTVMERNIIILPKEAVFAGNAPDYTPVIAESVDRLLSGQAQADPVSIAQQMVGKAE